MADEIRGSFKGSLAAYYAALSKIDEDRKKKGLKPIASPAAVAQPGYRAFGGSRVAVPGQRPGAWGEKAPDKPPPTRHWAFDIKGAM